MSNIERVSEQHAADARQKVANAKTVVVKVGSNVLVGDGPNVLDRARFCSLVESIANLADVDERKIILVTSGSVAVARRAMFGRAIAEERDSLARLQALAALGQPILMHYYTSEFEFYGKRVAQVLLAREDLSDRGRFLNSRRTLFALGTLDHVIPIINENDTVAHEELRFGDNDNLAALVTTAVGADLLIILSDIDAVYDANPNTDPNASKLDVVYGEDAELNVVAGPSGSSYGTGGMSSKVRAARMTCSSGIPMVVASGREPKVLERILAGEAVGTLMVPADHALSARKAWIGYGVKPEGSLCVDAGAARALRSRGNSLLPRGVIAVEGSFGVGDAVEVLDPDGSALGRGLVAYSSQDLQRIAGQASTEILRILGHHNGDAVVHVDDFALVEE